MLTKLISHEWKDTFKVPVLLLTITVLLSAASLVYFSVADQATADIDLNVRNFVLYIAYIHRIHPDSQRSFHDPDDLFCYPFL